MNRINTTKNSKRQLAVNRHNADCNRQSQNTKHKDIIALTVNSFFGFIFSVLSARKLSTTTQSIILILFVMAIVSLIYCIQFLIVYAVILIL